MANSSCTVRDSLRARVQLTATDSRARASCRPTCCRAPGPAPQARGPMGWAPGGGTRPGWRSEDRGWGGGGRRGGACSCRGGGGGLAGRPRAVGDGVGELQPSAGAAAVSVARASASGTRDGAPRISVFLTVI